MGRGNTLRAAQSNTGRFVPGASCVAFRDLCPVWGRECGGIDMLLAAIDWCRRAGAWPGRLLPVVTLSFDAAMLGIGTETGVVLSHMGDGVQRDSGGILVDADCGPMMPGDLAGAYAIMAALRLIWRESGISRMARRKLILLPELIEWGECPDLARLHASGMLDGHGHIWLLEIEREPSTALRGRLA